MRPPLKMIRSEAAYEAALQDYETYFDHPPAAESEDGDRFEILGALIAKYEDEHFPFPAAEPVEAVKLVMESRGYTKADLGRVLGSSPRATEILKGERQLSIDHIRRLHRQWRIPMEVLVGV